MADIEHTHDSHTVAPRVLLVGGSPETCGPELLKRLSDECEFVVAVDRGLDSIIDAGLACDLFCGDADSVGSLGQASVRRCEAGEPSEVRDVERYDPYKDFTDLALALRAIRSRWGAVELVCTCLTGGRPDHALAAIGCLLRWDGAIRLEEDGFSGRLLKEGMTWRMTGREGSTFSFVCLSPVAVVSELGMEWELKRKRVELLSDLGISNVVTSDARVVCHEGAIAAYLIR